jgi:MoxR-like ATPase
MITPDQRPVTHHLPQNVVAEKVHQAQSQLQQIVAAMNTVIVGNQATIESMVLSVMCNGHVLLEGIPGVAKTTMVKAMTQALGLDFKRIQFTPDLLPSDLIGTVIYNQQTHQFETKPGVIFTHVVLADEINRAPAKVQSALLEAMQEQQVTLGERTFLLEKPFIVFATQNPFEQEGTYRLPEAQVDRFFMKLLVHYPTLAQEKEIITRSRLTTPLSSVITKEHILAIQELIGHIYVDDRIIDYILALVFALRNPEEYRLTAIVPYLACGPSPRATLALYHAAQAHACLYGRAFVTPDDVKAVALPVLRHRITLNYQADAERIQPDILIVQLLKHIKTP